jgi:iron complex outermembrane receptor protein
MAIINACSSRASRLAPLLGGVAIAAMTCGAAYAQNPTPAPADPPPGVEEVVVTGSRVTRAGFTAPTPLTVVSAEQLQSQPLIADSLRQLPVLQASASPATQRNAFAGARASLNLRGLGSSRTLVLLDGKRFVAAGNNGSTDVSVFPNSLVSRVDVVTGGASAAYGSDAVAGVVNYVLNREYTGFKGSVDGGLSERGDNPNYSLSLAAGKAWGPEGRGHVLASYEHTQRWGMDATDRPAFSTLGYSAIVYAAPVSPIRQTFYNVVHMDINPGGLVTSGPLKGLTFGQGGTPRQFAYGTNQNGTYNVGGEGPLGSLGQLVAIGADQKRDIIFGRLSYDVTPDWNVYSELNFANVHSSSHDGTANAQGGTLGPLIQRDNAFLPASVRAQMVTSNITNFRINKMFTDLPFINLADTATRRAVVGLTGEIQGWKADAYYAYGSSKTQFNSHGMLNHLTLYPAIDAVISPTTGAIICRSTLTNPNNGCIPYNPLGVGVNTPEAIKYVSGDERWVDSQTQSTGGISFSGEPFSVPAGPVSLAFGGEFRRDTSKQRGDQISKTFNPTSGIIGGWRSVNQQDVGGSNSVKEAFAETVVPILKDVPFAESLDLNAAGRITDYRISGTVKTWKAGLTWKVTQDIRFRGTLSKDIRAPTLGELYADTNGGNAIVIDTSRGNITTNGVKTFTKGNLTLKPEIADTLTFGVVLSPHFVPGLDISIDRYDIDIKDAIANLATQATIDQCAQGATSICQFIIRDATNNITAVYGVPYNFANRRVKGIDFEASYRHPLALFGRDGNFSVRGIASRLDTDIAALPGAVLVNRAGQLGQWKWQGNLSMGYTTGDISSQLTVRYIDKSVYDRTWVEGVDIDDNDIPATAYVDLRLSKSFEVLGGKWTANLNINNLLDTAPVRVATVGGNGSNSLSTTTDYDLIGRAYRLGLSFQF